MENNILTGERIQQLADVYIGFPHDFHYNPFISTQTHKQKNMDDILDNYDNPRIVFCYSHHIIPFTNKIHFFQNPFVLITHNSDENLNETNVFPLVNHDKIIKWYSQNVCIHHPKLIPIPIGIANQMWPHHNIHFYTDSIKQLHKHKTKKIYMSFNINTNPNRKECYETLKHIPFLDNIHPYDNLTRLSEYEFCICPEGNGVDTHRLWECIYLQTIPIVLNTPFIQIIKQHINPPMVILNTWDEFNETVFDYSSYHFSDDDDDYYEKISVSYYTTKLNTY
jgi:hypothetical protein